MTETLSSLVYPTRPAVPHTVLFQKSVEARTVGFEVLWELGRVGLKLPLGLEWVWGGFAVG